MIYFLQELFTGEKITAILSTISAVGAGGVVFYKKVIAPTHKFVQRMSNLEQSIEKVYKELIPNGGGSLRDVVNKINIRTIKTEERQKAILNDATCAVFEADELGQFSYVNRSFKDWILKSADDLLGNNWVNSIYFEDRMKVETEWIDCVKRGRDFSMQFRMMSRHNEVFDVHASAQALRNQNGNIVAWFGIMQKFSDTHGGYPVNFQSNGLPNTQQFKKNFE